MISPTKELIKFAGSFESQSFLAGQLDVDTGYLSRVLNRHQSAGRRVIEAFYKLNGWPLSRAWEITDDKVQADSSTK